MGEIALVVIGILIALQINNWNDWRKDRIIEQDYLAALKDEFEFNLGQLYRAFKQTRTISRVP